MRKRKKNKLVNMDTRQWPLVVSPGLCRCERSFCDTNMLNNTKLNPLARRGYENMLPEIRGQLSSCQLIQCNEIIWAPNNVPKPIDVSKSCGAPPIKQSQAKIIEKIIMSIASIFILTLCKPIIIRLTEASSLGHSTNTNEYQTNPIQVRHDKVASQLVYPNQEARIIRQTSQEQAKQASQMPSEPAPIVDSGTGHTEEIKWILTLVYLAIFIIGVIGNVCNCLVIADSRNRYMKTATNYYLFSLSVSDLLLLIFGLPHDLVNLWHPLPYLFNEFVCISRGWISEASTYASVLVIVAFTVERYLAICHPLRAHTLSRLSRSIKMIILIWLVASSCALVVVMQFGIQTIIVNDDTPATSLQSNIAPAAALEQQARISEPLTVVDQESTSNHTVKTRAIAQCTTVALNETIFELSVLIFFIIPMAVITILYVKLGYHLRQKTFIIKQNRLAREQNLHNLSDVTVDKQQHQHQQHQSSHLLSVSNFYDNTADDAHKGNEDGAQIQPLSGSRCSLAPRASTYPTANTGTSNEPSGPQLADTNLSPRHRLADDECHQHKEQPDEGVQHHNQDNRKGLKARLACCLSICQQHDSGTATKGPSYTFRSLSFSRNNKADSGRVSSSAKRHTGRLSRKCLPVLTTTSTGTACRLAVDCSDAELSLTADALATYNNNESSIWFEPSDTNNGTVINRHQQDQSAVYSGSSFECKSDNNVSMEAARRCDSEAIEARQIISSGELSGSSERSSDACRGAGPSVSTSSSDSDELPAPTDHGSSLVLSSPESSDGSGGGRGRDEPGAKSKMVAIDGTKIGSATIEVARNFRAGVEHENGHKTFSNDAQDEHLTPAGQRDWCRPGQAHNGGHHERHKDGNQYKAGAKTQREPPAGQTREHVGGGGGPDLGSAPPGAAGPLTRCPEPERRPGDTGARRGGRAKGRHCKRRAKTKTNEPHIKRVSSEADGRAAARQASVRSGCAPITLAVGPAQRAPGQPGASRDGSCTSSTWRVSAAAGKANDKSQLAASSSSSGQHSAKRAIALNSTVNTASMQSVIKMLGK